MRMEQYLTHTDYALWEVIVNGDAPASIESVSGGADTAIPPKITKQKIAKRNELKAKSTMLLAIPDEQLLKFHGIKDAKNLWEAIKTRFRGNKESKKLQKTILKQYYENFAASRAEDNTSSINEAVNTAHDVSTTSSQGQAFASTYADDVMFSFFANQSNSPQLDNKDLKQIDTDDLKVMDLKWQVRPAQILSQLNERDLNNKSNVFENAYDSSVNESEEDNNQTNDRYKADDTVFKSAINETVTSMNEAETSASKTSKESIKKPKSIRPNALIIKDWEFDSNDDCEIRPSIEQIKPSHAKINFVKLDENTRKYVIEQHTYKQAENLRKRKSVLNNKGKATGQKEVRPLWNNAQRVNHQNLSNNLTHPHPKMNFVPTTVITNSGKVPVNTAKQSSPRAKASTSTARYVNTAASRPTVNGAKPSSNVFHKSHSLVRRTFNQRIAPKNSDLKEKINTAKVNNVITAGIKAVVSAV
nr:ribonuclease H-like domain-containing protein [Tanacetum cinerariifolium]